MTRKGTGLNLRNGVIVIGLFDIAISILVIINNMVSLMEKFTDAIDSRRSYFYISTESEIVDIIGIGIYTMIMLSAGVLIAGVIKGKPKHLKPWMSFKLLLVGVGALSQIVYLCVLSAGSEGGTKARVVKYIFIMELAVVLQFVLAIYMLVTVSTYYSLLRNAKDVERSCTETC
ncbi:LAPTM4A family protein [Megaselia abdita]